MREISKPDRTALPDILMAEKSLPKLPSLIRYLDDFADEWRVIRDTGSDDWVNRP